MAAWLLGCHTFLAIAILTIWRLPGIYSKGDVIGEEANQMQFDRLTVYDVSEALGTIKNSTQKEFLPEILFVKDANTSEYYYYQIHGGADYTDYEASSVRLKWKVGQIKGISVMFGNKANKDSILAMTDTSMDNENIEIEDTLIVKFLKTNNSFVDSVTFLLDDNADCTDIPEFIKYFVKELNITNLKYSVKFGLEYNDEFLERCAEEWFPLAKPMDHTVLRIHVFPLSTILSFQIFFERLHSLITKNRDFVQKFNKECTLFIRIQNENWEGSEETLGNTDRFNALMAKYLRAFSKNVTGKEVYIFRPSLKSVRIAASSEFFGENVAPQYYGVFIEDYKDSHLSPCEHQQVATTMLSNSRNVRFYDDRLEIFKSLFTTCRYSQEIPENHLFALPRNSSLSVVLTPFMVSLKKIVKQLVKILEEYPTRIRVQKVYIGSGFLDDARRFRNAVNLLQAKHIQIGCYDDFLLDNDQGIDNENISTFVANVVKRCGPLLNLSNEILLDFRIRVLRQEHLFTFLRRFQLAKQYFENMFPGKIMTVDIDLNVRASHEIMDRSTLYCDSKVKLKNVYYDILLYFAHVQGWSSLGFRAYELNTFWSYVETDQDVNRSATRFSLFYRTNAPLSSDQELPMTYACIEKTKNAKQSQINFLANQYSGASFRINLREKSSVSTGELETLLRLTLKAFPFVELIAASGKEFSKAHNVISAVVKSFRHLPNISGPLVYIQVPFIEAINLHNEILAILSNNRSAVHLSNWESLSHVQWNLLKGLPQSSTLNFGVTVQNCSHEINSRLATLKSVPFMRHVQYVLCNVKPVIPDNLISERMNKYLGSLFYTKSYMEHFLSSGIQSGSRVEVIFRLNFICSKTIGMEQRLRFLNDVNQYCTAYKIRCFAVTAFETERFSENCSNSWWRLDSYADLSNRTAYVNTEDEYAGRPAREKLASDKHSNADYYIVFVPIVTLLLLALLALWLYHQRMKTRFLTEREVSQFYNGGGEQIQLSTLDKDYLTIGNMKFPQQYEIPLKDIDIEEMIGSGQFGVVHRGTLAKRVEVAIKIPLSHCGKEQFKSALAELKILCHIGKHLNIVTFLGACTKDIANGKLQIAMEYCENGSLLKFLRAGRESEGTSRSITTFQLYGFSLQIAAGMEYVAGKRVIHGDLAARNVLLTTELTCKISDFGLSRQLYEMNEYKKTSEEPLPWRWTAPDTLRNFEFTIKSDVWSYGVTLWEIFSLGMIPYPGMNWTVNFVTQLENGMRMEKAPYASDDVHAKTMECWNKNSEARPTFTELKEFFISLRDEQYLKLDQV